MQLIDRSAVTCRIREESQSDEEYEKLNPNEGQPLNVWRVDMEVANYSGRLLDHLLVFLDVESKWPPCTSWDGPERSYGKVHKFAGSMMRLQRTGKLTGLPPGEVARETEILLVWHREEPTLGRWTIDYDFADPPRTGEPQTPPETAPEAPRIERPATGLPPQRASREDLREEGRVMLDGGGEQAGLLSLARQRALDRAHGHLDGRMQQRPGARLRGAEIELHQRRGQPGSSVPELELAGRKKEGRWTLRSSDGGTQEGPHIDGRTSGHWVIRLPSDAVMEGRAEAGYKREGRWTNRSNTDESLEVIFIVPRSARRNTG